VVYRTYQFNVSTITWVLWVARVTPHPGVINCTQIGLSGGRIVAYVVVDSFADFSTGEFHLLGNGDAFDELGTNDPKLDGFDGLNFGITLLETMFHWR